MTDRKRGGKRRQVKAAGNGKSSAKKSLRGKPFRPGSPYRWQPGQSGNPAGSSRKQLISAALRDVLAHPMPLNLKEHIAQMIADGATVAEIIAWATASGALKGNVAAIAEIRKATESDRLVRVQHMEMPVSAVAELSDEELSAIATGEVPQDGDSHRQQASSDREKDL